jgi:diguanylate cyclase (GGDEF)-like protein
MPENGRETRVRYRILYAFVGVLLGTGAPLGALLIRQVTGTLRPGEEIRAHLFYYTYELIATCLIFAVAGFLMGLRTDRLRAGRDRFRELAARDDLTGLPNRRLFGEHYARVVSRSHRFRQPLSLLLVDVDALKEINDRWGHMAGNAALRHVARLMHERKRSEDLAARWGGDEFVLLLPGADASSAERVAREIVQAAQRSTLNTPPGPVTVTVGVATGIASSPDHDFFTAADQALYEGKAAGRSQYRLVKTGDDPAQSTES